MQPDIDRGEVITEPNTEVSDIPSASQGRNGHDPGLIGAPSNGYMRYKHTESGISPRALPGLPGYVHVVASDEQDEDGVLISDEFTNPHKRRKMVEKRARKFKNALAQIAPPLLEGPEDAEVTLIGWGSTYGVIKEAIEQLKQKGISANHLPIKWIVPLHVEAVTDIVSRAGRTIIVENNYSGQFFRYLRSETGLAIDGHIRKYDGEPFMPHHIVDGVMEQLDGKPDLYVPIQEIMV